MDSHLLSHTPYCLTHVNMIQCIPDPPCLFGSGLQTCRDLHHRIRIAMIGRDEFLPTVFAPTLLQIPQLVAELTSKYLKY